MTSVNQAMPSRALSLALGLMTASIGVLLSHLFIHLWLYGDGDAPALRFFTRPGISAGVVVVVSLAVFVAVLRSRRGSPLEVSGRVTFVWAVVSALVLNVVPVFGMAWSERGGEYFGFALYAMGLLTTPVALVVTLLLAGLIVEGYRLLCAAQSNQETRETFLVRAKRLTNVPPGAVQPRCHCR